MLTISTCDKHKTSRHIDEVMAIMYFTTYTTNGVVVMDNANKKKISYIGL